MSDYKVADTELTSIANAIRTKGGTSRQLTFPADFITAIENISGGGGGGSTNILSGTEVPSASLGSDGDIYLRLYALIQELVTQQSELHVDVTSNSNWSGYEPWKAFTSYSGWIGRGGNPHWLQIGFLQETVINEINFKSFDSVRSHAISRIGYSNDGENFTDAVLTESTMSSNIGHVLLGQTVSARYFRLYFDGTYDSSTYPMVGALQIYGSNNIIGSAYLKANGAWQDLIGGDIDDVNTGGGNAEV